MLVDYGELSVTYLFILLLDLSGEGKTYIKCATKIIFARTREYLKANLMGRYTKSEEQSYGIGALIVFAISLGFAAIFYGGGILVFEPLNLLAWALGPLGAYTVLYALRVRRDSLYYLSWGLIMLTIGLASALYNVVSVIVLFGLLIIVLAVISLLAYWRRK